MNKTNKQIDFMFDVGDLVMSMRDMTASSANYLYVKLCKGEMGIVMARPIMTLPSIRTYRVLFGGRVCHVAGPFLKCLMDASS